MVDAAHPPQTIVLVTTDVLFDAALRPLAYCSSDIDISNHEHLVEATITARIDAVKVETVVSEKIVKFRCPVGQSEPGQTVLLRLKRSGDHLSQDANARLVGPLSDLPERDIDNGLLLAGRPLPVLVTGCVSGGTVTGTTANGVQVELIRSIYEPNPKIGNTYACATRSTRVRGDPGRPSMDIISTKL
jgi:hypothetical protein